MNSQFRRFWLAETISLLGTQVTRLALPLAAILTLSAGPGQLSVLSALLTAPFLIVGLFVGVWVDRWPRRRILVRADLGRAVLLGTVPLAAVLDVLTLPWLYAVAFCVGTLTVFYDVAYQSLLPALVSRDSLPEANAKLALSDTFSRLAGPTVGGALVQLVTAPIAVLVDALSYVGSAALLTGLPAGEPDRSATAPGTVLAQLREGVRLVARSPVLRTLAASGALLNLCDSAFSAVLLLFLTDDAGLAPGTIGVAFAVGSAGGFAGSWASTRGVRRFGEAPTVVVGALAIAAGRLLVLLVPGAGAGAAAVLAGALVVTGFGAVSYNVVQVSLRQRVTPDPLLGRMNATMRFVSWGALPLGALAGGLLAELLGVPAGLAVSAAGLLLPPLLLAALGRHTRSSAAVEA